MPREEVAVAKTRKKKPLPDPEGKSEAVEKPVGPKRQTLWLGTPTYFFRLSTG